MMKEVIAYTDGSCMPNPGTGGYGVVLISGTARKELSGAVPDSTNQRMEVIAATKALEALNQSCAVTFFSDSQYFINIATGQWKRKSNLDVWAEFDKAAQGHTLTYKWVKGHAGNVENERADVLANNAIYQHLGIPT
jgi:ribonuclease HI